MKWQGILFQLSYSFAFDSTADSQSPLLDDQTVQKRAAAVCGLTTFHIIAAHSSTSEDKGNVPYEHVRVQVSADPY